MGVTKKTGEVVATFPVTDDHQVMLVTDQGKLIRTPVDGVRYTGRSAQGVTLFKVASDEKVVSVAWLINEEDEEETTEAAAVDGEATSTNTNSEENTSEAGGDSSEEGQSTASEDETS